MSVIWASHKWFVLSAHFPISECLPFQVHLGVILVTTLSDTSTKTQTLTLTAWPMHIKYYLSLTFRSGTNTASLFSIKSTAGREAFYTRLRGSMLLQNPEEWHSGTWDWDEPWETKPRLAGAQGLVGKSAWCKEPLFLHQYCIFPPSPACSLPCISKLESLLASSSLPSSPILQNIVHKAEWLQKGETLQSTISTNTGCHHFITPSPANTDPEKSHCLDKDELF